MIIIKVLSFIQATCAYYIGENVFALGSNGVVQSWILQ